VFEGEANCLELNGLGIVPVLVKLLESPDKAVRSYSVICLATLSTHGEKEQFTIIVYIILC